MGDIAVVPMHIYIIFECGTIHHSVKMVYRKKEWQTHENHVICKTETYNCKNSSAVPDKEPKNGKKNEKAHTHFTNVFCNFERNAPDFIDFFFCLVPCAPLSGDHSGPVFVATTVDALVVSIAIGVGIVACVLKLYYFILNRIVVPVLSFLYA